MRVHPPGSHTRRTGSAGPLRQALVAVAIGFGAASMTASAQSAGAQPVVAGPSIPADATLLSVSAQGEASRAPDIATLSAGVVTQAVDARAASQANARQMARVMDAVREAGIAERDVQTSGISLHPQYRHVDDAAPAITGYQASNTVNVKVRDLDRLGEVMDALVASGANQVHGPGFEIDQPESVRDQARRQALEKAQERAGMYAETLGLRVRRIVSISEGGGFSPPMPMMAMAREQAADAGTPIAPGESTLQVNLDVVFELGR